MIFITREWIALLESKFHFQIEDWNLPTVDSFEITNVDCVLTYINQKFTREIRNHWRLLLSVSLTLQGIFFKFQEHFLCIYSRLVFKKLFFMVLWQRTVSSLLKVFATNILLSEHKSSQICQAASSLLLAREHSPHVNNKPISILYLEQGYHCNITIFNLKVEFWFQ